MGDEELEEIINHVLMQLIPEAVEVIWEEFKEAIDEPLQKVCSMMYICSVNSLIFRVQDLNSRLLNQTKYMETIYCSMS